MLEGDGHGAGVVGVTQAQTAEAPWKKAEEGMNGGQTEVRETAAGTENLLLLL